MRTSLQRWEPRSPNWACVPLHTARQLRSSQHRKELRGHHWARMTLHPAGPPGAHESGDS
eukprot:8615168-Pyramimonas_sp.AAC.1